MNARPSASTRSLDFVVIATALIIRGVAWRLLHGPIMAGDASFYLQLGAEIGRGQIGGLAQWPFHALYAFTLAPPYFLTLPVSTYIAVLHIALSTATVMILMRTAAVLGSPRYATLVGAAAAVNPFFLQWLPYVLTETFFFFVFACYAYVAILLLKRLSWIRVVTYAAAAAVAVLSRPVALPVVAVTTCLVVLIWVDRIVARPALNRRFAILGAVALALFVTGAGLFAAVRPRLMTLPTVVQGLWASTVLRVGNMDDVRAFGARDEQVDVMFAGRLGERDRYKIAEALAYIRTNPGQYFFQAGVKVVSFFFPWMFAANTWSPPHRAIDALFSIFLVAGALLALGSNDIERLHAVTLLTMALTLAVLSAFSLMDPDGRYRVPAEVVLLPLAPAGWIQGLTKIASSFTL